ANPCDMPAQLANESFRADHVRFGNSLGAVVQVLMRSDVPAAEAFFRDHLLFGHQSISSRSVARSSMVPTRPSTTASIAGPNADAGQRSSLRRRTHHENP